MRLLHIIASANPKGGGPIEGVCQLSKVFRTQGHTIEIASIDNPDETFLNGLPFTVHALGPARLGYRYTSRFVAWLREMKSNYDAVIVNGLWQYHSFGTWRALHRTQTPYFVYTHGMLDPWFKYTYPVKHAKKWLYWPWAEYRVLRDARAVLFTCEEERRLARQSFWLYKCHEHVVRFGTSAVPHGLDEHRGLFQNRFPETKGKRLILFLSRIHVKKGCDLLIRSFAAATRRDRTLHLVMAGPDQTGWRTALETLAATLGITNRITWTGMLAGDLKWGAYRNADAFILPSHQENFGIVVAEALSCGVPVLISNKVNIWREVESNGAGLVENDDLSGTASLLDQWLSMAATSRDLMRANARRCFENHFEISQAATSLMDALRSNGVRN